MTELIVRDMTVVERGVTLVENATFVLRPGEVVALLGPNGAGKTTLLRAALGLRPRTSGIALLDGLETASMEASRRARLVSYLPQIRPLAWPSPVRDVVALGRFAHGAALGRLAPEDRQAVDRALAACDLEDFAHRATDTLSGGELARVHCARAFAAQTPLLIADEPVAALDPLHQHQTMALIRHFANSGGGVLTVLHDLTLAARFVDRLIWIKDGRILGDGPVRDVLTTEWVETVYGMRAEIDFSGDAPHVRMGDPV